MKSKETTVRYAVVGLGYIAQAAMLPGFAGAKKNSRLTALISGEPKKLKVLGKHLKVQNLFSYEQYDEFLASGVADAVYIALPNTLHREYAVKAANAGLHVLCEKPMATTEKECRDMMGAARRNNVRLMIAYRLHFDRANIEAINIIKSGKIGDPRYFHSSFSRQVPNGDIRLEKKLGGGTLWDMGIYCINAARYLFRDEPTQALAVSVKGTGPRFQEVDEMTAATLSFPGDRIATFTSSFGAAESTFCEVIGTKGSVRLEPAFDYSVPLTLQLTIGEKKTTRKMPKYGQFAAQLVYFSECVLTGRVPEPSGLEGMADVNIIRALYRSAEKGRPVKLAPIRDHKTIRTSQEMTLTAPGKPELVDVSS